MVQWRGGAFEARSDAADSIPRFRLPGRGPPLGTCPSAHDVVGMFISHPRCHPSHITRLASLSSTPHAVTDAAPAGRPFWPLPHIAAHFPTDPVSGSYSVPHGAKVQWIYSAAFVVPAGPGASRASQAGLSHPLRAPARLPFCIHTRRRRPRVAASPAPAWRRCLPSMAESSSASGAAEFESLRTIRSRSEMDKASDLAFDKLVSSFRSKVVIKDRTYHLKTYKSCFTGEDAVRALRTLDDINSVDDALTVGNGLMAHGVFEHVLREHPLKNGPLFYRFVNDERGATARGADGARVSWSDYLTDSTSSTVAGLTGSFPGPDLSSVPSSSVHVATAVAPLDEHNVALLNNVHPASWVDPTPSDGFTYHLLVLGAGAGGLVTAAGAAGVGAKVALVEAHMLGGDCLNVGCVPSKALIRAARAASDLKNTKRLADMGISIKGEVEIDFGAVMTRLRRLRAKISENDSAARFSAQLGCDVYLGYGKFTGPNTLVVNGQTLRFAKAVVATGGYPQLLPIPGMKELAVGWSGGDATAPVIATNESIWNLTKMPRRLLVIGTGVIGMELAQAMQRLGSTVTMFGRSGKVLPKEDQDLAAIIKQQMVTDGVQFRLRVTKYVSVELTGVKDDLGFQEMKLTTVEAGLHGTDVTSEFLCDAILVAAGRQPNVTGFDLGLAGVNVDVRKGLTLNDQLQTSNPNIFGVGDVTGKYQFTHSADAQARMVIRNALFFGKSKFSNLLIPWATFTSPEIAHVGLYAADIKAAGKEYVTYEKSFEHNDRAILEGETDGVVRILVEKGSDRILGATIVGPEAGDMISEITVAMQAGMGLGALAGVIHPYPTFAESIARAGDLYNKTKLSNTVRLIFRQLLKVHR